jgi:TrmH family RNA methyltransferase
VALDAGAGVESVYIDPAALRSRPVSDEGPDGSLDAALDAADGVEALLQRCLDAGARVFELDPGVLSRVADTASPQPVLAVVGAVDVSLARLREYRPDLVVVCVDVRDPGNAGAVLRAAEAAGAGGVIYCGHSVDLSNPKTVRASAGTLFQVPVVAGGEPGEVLDELGQWSLVRLGTAAHHGSDYTTLDLTRPAAIVVGNEAHGLPVLDTHLDELISIPMAGRAESLNVAVAAAVVCFEAARQRRLVA